ncbi:MAG: glycosyltransferase [Alphaproteobacteria bacterium]|nr:MAG: glycosyltransferase [Alphaproteobacteria bacterium]
MKLGMVVNSPSPHQVALLDAISELVDLKVVYAFDRNPARTWGRPITKADSDVLPWNCWCSLWTTKSWLKAQGRDVWVLGSIYTSVRTQVVAHAVSELGLPLYYLGEPPRPRSGPRGWLRDKMLQGVLKHCRGVIGTGVESARRYQKIIGERPAVSVPYYVPLDDWLALPVPQKRAPDSPTRFVTLAQFIHRKGLDVLIEACRGLPKEGWTLEVFGDGPERAKLQSRVDELGIPVKLHHPIPFARRTEAFKDKHCFVFPTRWDGWGMVIPEALAAGLPVITTVQAMSAHDFVSDGEVGWIGPAEDPQFLLDSMLKVINSPERSHAMSQAARNAVADYRPEVGARRLAEFIDRHTSELIR